MNTSEKKPESAFKIDVNTKDENGHSLLHYFVNKGNTEAIDLLIEKGAKIEVKDFIWGDMPLHKAAKDGERATVKLLIERRARLNARSKYCSTPLHGAAERGYTEIVKFLIDKGAHLNARNNYCETPLNMAT